MLLATVLAPLAVKLCMVKVCTPVKGHKTEQCAWVTIAEGHIQNLMDSPVTHIVEKKCR